MIDVKNLLQDGGGMQKPARYDMRLQVLAEALLGFIDADRNGRIEGGELKVLGLKALRALMARMCRSLAWSIEGIEGGVLRYRS